MKLSIFTRGITLFKYLFTLFFIVQFQFVAVSQTNPTAVSETASMGFCHTPSVSENYLKGYQLNPANSVGPFTVKIHIHHCLHADGSGGINPAEIAILKQGLDADFAEHNISFVYCESTHYEKSQEFSFADQEDPNSTLATLEVDDAINVFLYPDDFQYNDGTFSSSTVNAGGSAFSIPSTKLIVWGYVILVLYPMLHRINLANTSQQCRTLLLTNLGIVWVYYIHMNPVQTIN